MGTLDQPSSRTGGTGASLVNVLRALHRLITFPVAIFFALFGQLGLGWLVMAITPPPDPAAPGSTDGAIWAQMLLLLLQGAALVIAVSRAGLKPSRVFLAGAALVWAIASMLLLYVAFQCDLGAACL